VTRGGGLVPNDGEQASEQGGGFAVKGNRRSDDVVPAASSGALAVLPGWAFTGPFAWGLDAGLDAGAADGATPAPSPDLHIDLDPTDSDDALTEALPFAADRESADMGDSGRRVVAAEVLWQALRTSRFDWQRSIALDGEMLSFYCASARVALEILDAELPQKAGRDSAFGGSGVRLIPISISDVEQRCATIVGWLDELCAASVPAPGAVAGGRWRRRRPAAG
jgi:very-short-patch-repair endonuclease